MNTSIIIILLITVDVSFTVDIEIKEIVNKKVSELIKMQGTMYKSGTKLNKSLEDSKLEYPGINKEKLSVISHNWSKYYECLSQLTQSLTKSLQLPNEIVRVYSGSVARLPCNLCVSPAESDQLIWLHAQSTEDIFHMIEEKETVTKDIDFTIHYTRIEDSGVYQCKLGNSYGGFVILEVADEELFNIVKPESSRGPYPKPPVRISRDLVVITSWSVWSECSRCNSVGRRRRNGICFVGIIDSDKVTEDPSQNLSNIMVDNETRQIFHAFPKGIPCRSDILPTSIRNITSIQSRPNEIMIGLCKVPCIENIVKIRSQSNEIIEQVNNSAGIYSLCQKRPLQPPDPTRDIMFVSPGQEVTIVCPGTILRDVPVIWRIGTRMGTSKDIDRRSESRVRLDARDHIIFNPVDYRDAAVYSCWQDGVLAGVVKVVVRNDVEAIYKRRFALISIITAVAGLLRLGVRYLHQRQRRVRY